MSFTPIKLNDFVKQYIKINPGENQKEIKSRLKDALHAYNNGERCRCGNRIWVIGSAIVGYSCFTCITGEADPSEDYEIDGACDKL